MEILLTKAHNDVSCDISLLDENECTAEIYVLHVEG
jgi:hypothetical protein